MTTSEKAEGTPQLQTDHATWGPILVQLSEDMKAVDEIDKVGALHEPWRARVQWVRASTFDVLHSTRLYLLGFEIAKAEPTRISEPTRSWVANANTITSANLQMCVQAANLCAILESAAREMATAFISEEDVARVARKREVKANPKEALAQLIKWTSPTSMTEPETWCARFAEIFDVSLSSAARTALASLVTLRHAFIHERQAALAGQPVVDEAHSWAFAVIVATTLVAKRVSERTP